MNFIKKNIKHFENLLDYIKEHLFCIVLLILVFIISFVILKLFPSHMPNEIQSQEIYICGISLTNIGVWFTGIGLVITAFWSMFQFSKSVSRKQQENGAEIAKLFSDDLLEKCAVLGKVFLDSELNTLLKYDDFNYTAFKNFDVKELIDLYDGDDEICRKIKIIISSNEIQQIYLRKLESSISLNDYISKTKAYTTEEARKIFILNNTNMPFKFIDLISSVLNTLEYISMYISSQSTDSKYVYQSLHQIFLKTVKLLAPIICFQNKNYSDKLYTNVIFVYKDWCRLNEKDKKIENKKKEKIYKILNPKIKAV